MLPKSFPTLFGCEMGTTGHVVVIGVPYDRGTAPEHSGGCCRAPSILRAISSPEVTRLAHGQLRDVASGSVLFEGRHLSDLGNIRFRPERPDNEYGDLISKALLLIISEGKIPFSLGGDHLICLLALRAFAKAGKVIQVLQLDAHQDVEQINDSDLPTHASFVSFAASENLALRVIQVGVRGFSGGMAEPPDNVIRTTVSELRKALIPGVDVYLTVDTDAFDPSLAQAVNYPEPEGLTYANLVQILEILRSEGSRCVGADWSEYNPLLDTPNLITGRFVLKGIALLTGFLLDDYETIL